MRKLNTLKPRVTQANILSARKVTDTGTTRIRGSALMKRNKRLFQANPLCVECQSIGVARVVAEWDHVVPLWQGGHDHESNLQGLCIEHHLAKSKREDALRQSGQYEMNHSTLGRGRIR
jgi:5-methylcytosine-specific restriction enzyme A